MREREAGEALLRQFVRHTPAAMAMFDTEMRYIQASDRWLADYHLTGAIVGRSHYDVFPGIPDRWKAVHERVLDGAVERSDEDTFVRADGTTDWLHWELRPWRDATGAIGGVIMFAQVITERKRAEQALQESDAQRRRVEEQLRQSQKMEAIGQLAGGVAHDFNNILSVIMMQAELASVHEGVPGEVREFLSEIAVSADRAASLTRQLLAFSRRQVMQPRDIDLNDSVSHLARMLRRILGEDVRLQLNLHAAPMVTYADPGMVDQVIMNLAVNARDAMPGGGRLIIETAVLDVSERGPGRRRRCPGRAATCACACRIPARASRASCWRGSSSRSSRPSSRARAPGSAWPPSSASSSSTAARCGSTAKSARARRSTCCCRPRPAARDAPPSPDAGRGAPRGTKPCSWSKTRRPFGR